MPPLSRNLPLVLCEVCRSVIERKRQPSGRLEPPHIHVKRKVHVECRGRWLVKTPKSRKRCLFSTCQDLLARKRRPCGSLEKLSDFRRRKWCSRAHQIAWSDETEIERTVAIIDAEKLCTVCGVEPQRKGRTASSRTLPGLCRHCAWWRTKGAARKQVGRLVQVSLMATVCAVIGFARESACPRKRLIYGLRPWKERVCIHGGLVGKCDWCDYVAEQCRKKVA